MHRLKALLCVLGLSLALTQSSAAKESLPWIEEETQVAMPAIDSVAKELTLSQGLVGLAVGYIESGVIRHLKGYGYQDREAQLPMSARTSMLRWASISKPVTAVVAARMADEGLIQLDAHIDRYFTSYRAPRFYLHKCRKSASEVELEGKVYPCERGYAALKLTRAQRRLVTLENLLGHTAGIMGYGNARRSATPRRRDLNNPKKNKGLRWGIKTLLRRPLASAPESEYGYSTFGFNLAAVALEEVSGESFPDLIAKYVSLPAGLRTLQPDYGWVDIPHRAAGYRKPRRSKTLVRQKTYDVSWKMAGGGLISTPEDLAIFCGALMDDSLLTDARKAQLWTERKTLSDEPTEYGLGFAIGQRDGRRFVEHAGVQPKTRTHLRLYPDEQRCLVVMSNTTSAKTTKLIDALDRASRQPALP